MFASFVCGSVFEQLTLAHDLSGKSEFCLSGEVRELGSVYNTFKDGGHLARAFKICFFVAVQQGSHQL